MKDPGAVLTCAQGVEAVLADRLGVWHGEDIGQKLHDALHHLQGHGKHRGKLG